MAALSLDVREKWFPAVGDAPAKMVLDGIRVTVATGERLAVIGPSGCGKTTLLNLVAGLDAGFVGKLDLAPAARLAYVFQEPRLLPWRTVGQNLRLVLPEAPDPSARVAAALAEVGLEAAEDVYASRLSLGMARRVALARAFVVEPNLLLLDEPFVSLDEPTAQRLRFLLLDLLDRHRTTALFVTHSLHEAIMVADRLLFLSAAPARVMALREVPLGRADRRKPRLVEAFRERLLGEERQVAELLLPPRPPDLPQPEELVS
jgi:ABC-type nitrate/sulfonate/bicarbonate transport system ATPase subunit